jgi:hypothetical protein
MYIDLEENGNVAAGTEWKIKNITKNNLLEYFV